MPGALQQESPNLRRDLMQWTAQRLQAGKPPASQDEVLALIQPAIACLQDRNVDVRKASQLLLVAVHDALGEQPVKKRVYELAPKQAQSIFQTIQQQLAATTASSGGNPFQAAPNASVPSSAIEIRSPTTPTKGSSGTTGGNAFAGLVGGTPVQAPPQAPAPPRLITCSQESKAARSNAKWNAPDGTFVFRQDLVDSLRAQFEDATGRPLADGLFSPDFKQQVAAMTQVEQALEAPDDSPAFINGLDLFFKYLTLRMAENNPVVFLKCLDLLERFVALADHQIYRLTDYEASCILPTLIPKAGESKESLRGRLAQIFRQLCRIYPASKLFGAFLEGLRAKTANTRSFCLEEMSSLVARNGLTVLQPGGNRQVSQIASMVADRDSRVRSVALTLLVHVYNLHTPDQQAQFTQRYMGGVSKKEVDMFEERLRRSVQSATGDGHSPNGIPNPLDAEGGNHEDIEMQDVGMMEGAKGGAESDTEMRDVASAPTTPGAKRYTLDLPPSEAFRDSLRDPHHPHHHHHHQLGDDEIMMMPSMGRPLRSAEPRSTDPLDEMVDQMLNSADLLCIQALQKITTHNLLSAGASEQQVDAYVSALAVRLRAVSDPTALELISRDGQMRAQKNRLAVKVVDACIALVDQPALLNCLSNERLCQFLFEIISALISEPICNVYEEHDALCKSINGLLLRVLDNLDLVRCFEVLLDSLVQAFLVPPPPASQNKLPEYLMKCVWKVTKHLPERLPTCPAPHRIAWAAHHFFQVISPMEWKSRASQKLPYEDLPLRTVKTIIHELVQVFREGMLDIDLPPGKLCPVLHKDDGGPAGRRPRPTTTTPINDNDDDRPALPHPEHARHRGEGFLIRLGPLGSHWGPRRHLPPPAAVTRTTGRRAARHLHPDLLKAGH